MGSYRQGRILHAYLRSSTGKKEAHPAIILDQNKEIIQPEHFDPRKELRENFVYVIGVSTKHKAYKLEFVQLPFSPSGNVVTKLRADCGAIIGWYHRISIPDDVIGFGGDVPTGVMVEIENAVRKDLSGKIAGQLGNLRNIFDELLDE
ncbi:MAG TPA: hypothetical protein VGN88_11320 [Phycisphaerae bacterium]|jgi:hypothetical protein